MYPIFRFPFSEAAAVINRVVMRCQIRIMYVASAGHGQTTIKLSTARAVCHTASNFPIVVCTTPHHTAPHRTAAYRECGGRQNLFGGVPRAMTTSLSLENRLNFCPKRKRYSNIFGQIDCCRCGSCKLPGIY